MNRPTSGLCSRLIAGILILVLLFGCMPAQVVVTPSPNQPWASALRALDLADTATPAYDLTAVYLRMIGANLQIRIDLLEFQNPKHHSLDIRIEDDSAPGAAPLEIHIPPDSDTARISLDPQLATVVVEVPLSEIPARPRVDVSTPEDEINGLTLDGPVPTRYAPLLLTFYDTFAGRFPAEALRSWDGAHTGPRGERHGLKHLLDAVEEYRVPIVLLDLKEPANLSALDAMGALPRIKNLAEEELLTLPENEILLEAASFAKHPRTGAPPGSAARAQAMDQEFGIPDSPFSYDLPNAGFQFVFLEDRAHLYRPLFSNTTYFPIAAGSEDTQPTPDGPSLEVRRALLATALNSDEKDLLVLGGDLRLTTWGSPDMAGPTLAYFASRPYIHILSVGELMNFPTRSGKPEILPNPLDESVSNLQSHYNKLTQPILEFAENWRGSPISTCGSDIDQDGGVECILADENYLAILDPQGARLTYLFFREEDDLHQLIGPSWQVAVGLSDPSTWDPSAGEAADPGAYPGAFADADAPFKPYELTIDGNTLKFTSADGARTKTFTLTETGIEVEYQTQEPVTTQIPLLVEPESRFAPGWAQKYVVQDTPDGVVWGLENGPRVSVQAEGDVLSLSKDPIKMRAFNENLYLLQDPENPDFGYPPGYTIPFPMAVVEVEISGDYSLSIERR